MRVLLLASHPFYQDRGTSIAVDHVLQVLSQRGDCVDVLTYHEGGEKTIPQCVSESITGSPFRQKYPYRFLLEKSLMRRPYVFYDWEIYDSASIPCYPRH